jgi:pyrimidine deaminase RibD-like protein
VRAEVCETSGRTPACTQMVQLAASRVKVMMQVEEKHVPNPMSVTYLTRDFTEKDICSAKHEQRVQMVVAEL